MHVGFVMSLTLCIVTSPAFAEVPKVAADIAPVHGLVSRVMDGVGKPVLVMPASASAHSHDLRPSEAAALESADVVFWVGEALTPWLERPVQSLASGARVVSLLDAEGTELLALREDEDFSDNHNDSGHAHDHGTVDPHAWLDPSNASLWLQVIAETLAQEDPENGDTYLANAVAGRAEIAQSFDGAKTRLRAMGPIRYAVLHDAYQYFETRFGLKPVGAVTLGEAAAPGPARIERIRKQFGSLGIDCFLIETQQDSALIDLFTEGGTVRIVELDPLGAGISTGPEFYTSLLASLVDSFMACR